MTKHQRSVSLKRMMNAPGTAAGGFKKAVDE